MAGDALTFRVAFVVRWLLWVVRFVVIWPLATMALMALFVLWKDNTTPGKLLVQEIDFVRQTAPAGQFPATGHNGPDGSVCFMEGQHHTRKITGSGN
ncbi:conjugal transfer protein TraP [Escherichia coli]|uniref:conjugal transfer protein TraP n=1 Tax=Escherichia coli TaxID=562 RepID=UPI002452FB99|nr:conjugal transfer protein TraP [Escherichia coli]